MSAGKPRALLATFAVRRELWLLALVLVVVWWVRTAPLELRALDAQAQRVAVGEAVDQLAREQGPVEPATAEALADDPAVRARQQALAESLEEQKTFVAEDGSRHVYLGGNDSYAWLRFARNQLEHGSPCDRVVDGRCRDELTLAPWGIESKYGRSAYVAAIVGLHRLLTLWNPHQPLSSSAYQLQVVLGLLVVFPAFFLGHRFGGAAGGVTAAVATSLNFTFLFRSLSADNDAWNVLLLLLLQAALMAALSANSLGRAMLYFLLAAGVGSVWATSWMGWIYGYLLAGTALVAHVGVLAVRRPSAGGLRRALALLAAGALATVLAAGLGGISWSAVRLLDYFSGTEASKAAAGAALRWPDVFATVDELGVPSLEQIAGSLGGRPVFVLAYLGLLLICLPATGWRRWEPAVLAAGALAPALLFAVGSPDRPVVLLAILGVPVLTALVLRVLSRRDDAQVSAAISMAVWCLSTFLLSVWGGRFLMLFGVPWAIALGAAVGRFHHRLAALVEDRGAVVRRWVHAALAVALALGLYALTRGSLAAAPNYLPAIGDATVATLESIRDTAPPDAIVTDLWERGYWVKYFARRRVHHDGGTLRTHVPYWVGRFYAAADDRSAVGILRMLNCGSDLSPLSAGRRGAWHRLQAAGKTPAEAFRLLNALIALDRASASRFLRLRGLSEAQTGAVLARTHCQPPESLVLAGNERLLKTHAWYSLARRDLLPASDPAPPRDPLFFGRWHSCRSTSPEGSGLGCELGNLGIRPRHDFFSIDLERPEDARLHRQGNRGATRRPGLLLLVEDGHLRTIEPEGADYPGLAVLVDWRQRRVLAERAEVLRSTMARLTLVEDYRSRFFEHLELRRDLRGESVSLWRVERWE